jgi:hypothetical protein
VKIVVATLAGQAQVGDVVHLHYMAPRGGRTTAGHVVGQVDEPMGDGVFRRRPETLEEVADALAKSAQGQYCGAKSGTPAFNVKAKANVVRVECKDEVDDVTFAAEVRLAVRVPLSAPGERISMELVEL